MKEEDQKQHKEERRLFVIYVGIGNINNEEDQQLILQKAYNAIYDIIGSHNADAIFIPVRDNNTRIECLNPQYITEDELIRKHRLLMDELHEHLDSHLLEILNKNKNE